MATLERLDTLYFKTIKTDSDGRRSASTMNASNTTFLFGFKLGLRGLMAYNATFQDINGVDPGKRGKPLG
jgi:hypothetical protein